MGIYLYMCVIQGKNNQHFNNNVLAAAFINSSIPVNI